MLHIFRLTRSKKGTWVFIGVLGFSFLFLRMASHSIAQSKERVIEDTIPKHIPLKFKIKEDKESKVKDLTNTNWATDLEIQVTNTSDKPIYYLAFFVVMPEILDGGIEVAFPMKFGRPEFIQFRTMARQMIPQFNQMRLLLL